MPIEQQLGLSSHQFRQIIKDKKIKVTLESENQGYKQVRTFEKPPTIKLSRYKVQFGSIAEHEILSSPPVESIIQTGNIIEIQTTQEGSKWTVEILEDTNY